MVQRTHGKVDYYEEQKVSVIKDFNLISLKLSKNMKLILILQKQKTPYCVTDNTSSKKLFFGNEQR